MKFPIHMAMPAVGAVGVLLWRLRETQKPLTRRRILIPPVAMSTGLGMFLFTSFQVPLTWAVLALLFGAAVLAWPLIKTSELYQQDGQVFLRRSRAFLWVLLGLLVVRLVLREQVAGYVTTFQTAGLFYLLALGMIIRWRANMWRRYRALVRQTGIDLSTPN